MKSLSCILLGLMILGNVARAATFRGSSENFSSADYYELRALAGKSEINLLNMIHVKTHFPRPRERYNRAKHFGAWFRPAGNKNCLDTRGMVLKRDAIQQKVQTTSAYDSPDHSQCRVKKGTWFDPYTAQYLDSPRRVQIDHLVPLKNAYMTGAHEWSLERRCLYANYMGNKFHLLSVLGDENEYKSDRAPDQYVPSNKKFVCTYLKYWLKTKIIWNLKITPNERNGIFKAVYDGGCHPEQFRMEHSELREQESFIRENANLCQI